MDPYQWLAQQRIMAMLAKAPVVPTPPPVTPMAYGSPANYPLTAAALGGLAGNDGAVPGPSAPYGGPAGGAPGMSPRAQGFALPSGPAPGGPASEFDRFVPGGITDPATRQYYATAIGQGRGGGPEADQFYNATGEGQYRSFNDQTGQFE